MAKVIKFARWVRNNWKKSTVFSIACYYGVDFLQTEYRKNSLVRQYCKEIVKYGEAPLPVFQSPRHILVILNPAANKKKARKEYDKYCAPLLHLSGAKVTLVSTSDEYNAIKITKAAITDDIDAVVVAGGDGTISEVVTGIFNLKTSDGLHRDVPLGIIPIGKENLLAKKLYSSTDYTLSNTSLDRVKLMMDATYCIIKELTTPLDVIESRNLTEEDSSFKPRYSLSYLQWGAFRDTNERMDKYWYFGRLRKLAAYVFGSQYNSPVQMEIKYTPPCSGCSKCYKKRLDKVEKKQKVENRRWWHAFVPRTTPLITKPAPINYETVINENCDKVEERTINAVELIISAQNFEGVPSLRLQIGPESIAYFDFVKEGWSRDHGAASSLQNEELRAQNIFVAPSKSSEENKSFFSIDKEVFETTPLTISLLHKVLPVFSFDS